MRRNKRWNDKITEMLIDKKKQDSDAMNIWTLVS